MFTAEPVGHRGGAPSKLSDDDRAALATWLDADDDATCDELAARLAAERGVVVSRATVNRAVLAAGLTRKERRSGRPSATVTM